MSGYEWIGLMMVESGGFPVLIQNNHSWNIHSSWPSIVFDDDDDDDDDGDGDDGNDKGNDDNDDDQGEVQSHPAMQWSTLVKRAP